MKHYNLYKVVREVRTNSGIKISESVPMRFADSLSALAREKYHDKDSYFVHSKKYAYWIAQAGVFTKVHINRVQA